MYASVLDFFTKTSYEILLKLGIKLEVNSRKNVSETEVKNVFVFLCVYFFLILSFLRDEVSGQYYILTLIDPRLDPLKTPSLGQ